MRFPYGCICRKIFFDKTETTDTTDTTTWKPGFTSLLSKVISLIVDLLSLRFIKLLIVFQISLGVLAFDSSLV